MHDVRVPDVREGSCDRCVTYSQDSWMFIMRVSEPDALLLDDALTWAP